jgi:hypothetical protein
MWRYLCLTELSAEYRTERGCLLPEYLGSTFRGVFGQELHAVSCVETTSPCDFCRRPDRCAAGALFDGPLVGQAGLPAGSAGGPAGAGGFDQPRPYILAPPSRNRGAYAPGVDPPGSNTRWTVAGLVPLGRRRHGRDRTTRARRRTAKPVARANLLGRT